MIESEYTAQSKIGSNEEILINSGGTSDCYKVNIRNRFYLIKRPKETFATNTDYLQLFHKEFDLGIQLDHPNIVRYYDLGKDDKGIFIRMDYVDGEDLDTFIHQNPNFFKSKKKRAQFIAELLNAICYIHAHEMLHLDIKPQNILITRHGQHVKLIDLGFAWTQSYLHNNGYSKEFCAPEQLDETNNKLSPATDIYAIGKILDMYRLAPASIIQHCTQQVQSKRYQSIETLQKAIQHRKLPYHIAFSTIIGLLITALFVGYLTQPNVSVLGNKAIDTLIFYKSDTLVLHQIDTIITTEPVKPKVLTRQELFRANIRHAFDSIYAPFYSRYSAYTEDMKFAIMEPFDAANEYADAKLSKMNLSFQDEIEYAQIISEEINRIMSPFTRMANSHDPYNQKEDDE